MAKRGKTVTITKATAAGKSERRIPGLWSEPERRAFAPPVKQTVTEWAEANRVLPAKITAEAGPYRVARTPYMREIMDAAADPSIEEIVALKAAQIAWSEGTRNILGFWIDNDPGPCLMVMPSEDAARQLIDERIRPLIEQTPAVERHAPARACENTKTGIKFDTMSLYVAWAGSPQALASRPCRYVILDEVDKYPAFSGREADPISLARERTKTFMSRRKLLIGSTPTTRQGHVWRAWEACPDRRDFHCPCPHCGEYQRLVWTQVKWPKLEEADASVRAERIEAGRLAWYECQHCKEKIVERQRLKMLAAGVWLSEGQTMDAKGVIKGERPGSKRIGFRISALYSPWCSFSAVAGEGIRSMGDPQKWMNFKNSWLAEVFEERISGIKVNELRERAEGAPEPGLVPAWAGRVIASADVQKDRFYYGIRAWGHHYKSQLIYSSIAMSFDELYERCLGTPLQVAGENGGAVVPDLLVIDAGYRTDEVYEFARSDNRIIPAKGANQKLRTPIQLSNAGMKEFGVALRYVDVDYFKDRLSTLRNDPERWLVHCDISEEYCQHLASEHKILVRKGAIMEERWVLVSGGAANHFLDVEVYNVVGSQLAGVDLIPAPETLLEMRRLEKEEEQKREQGGGKRSYLGNVKGWLKR